MRLTLALTAAALLWAMSAAAGGTFNPDVPNGGFALDVEYAWDQGRQELVQGRSSEFVEHMLSVSVLKPLSTWVTGEIGIATTLRRDPRLQVIEEDGEYLFMQCTPESGRHSFQIHARLRFYFG